MTSSTSPEDIEESKHVVLYLRCDEGSGSALADITNYKLDAKITSESWSH